MTPEIIDAICGRFEVSSLTSDEILRNNGQYDAEDVDAYKAGYASANSMLKTAVAIGNTELVRPLLEQFLFLSRFEVDVPESDMRRLALAYARTWRPTVVRHRFRLAAETMKSILGWTESDVEDYFRCEFSSRPGIELEARSFLTHRVAMEYLKTTLYQEWMMHFMFKPPYGPSLADHWLGYPAMQHR